jgi:fatty acid desaturase
MYWDHNRYCAAGSVFINLKRKTMKKNMGFTDKIVRIVVALIIAALYYMDVLTGTLGLVLLVLAGVFVLTSVFSICPLYLPFGLRTNASDKE